MYFTALTAFRFPTDLRDRFEDLDALLQAERLKPIGPQELATHGFVSPFGDRSQALHHRVGDSLLITLGTEERILPPKAIERALRERVEEAEKREGRTLGARARRQLKAEVISDMIPRAFTKHARLSAYLDLASGTMFVDTATRKAAEKVVSALRSALGSFPATPLNIACAPREILTGWVAGEPTPTRFAIGDEAELRDPVQQGAVIKAQRQTLHSDEIQPHLQAGKKCVRIGVSYDDRLTFVLDDALVVRKLKLTDIANESLTQLDADDLAAELDARFALFSALVNQLSADLFEVFAVSSATPLFDAQRKAA